MLVDTIMKMRILLDTILRSGLRLPAIFEYQIGWVHSFNRHFLSTPSSNEQNRPDPCPWEACVLEGRDRQTNDKMHNLGKVSSAVEKNKAGKRGVMI